LRLLRAVFRVKLSELAMAAGVSAREITRVENGQVSPARGTLERLDGALVTLVQARVKGKDGSQLPRAH
jgi:transcriptional regulator with XRE-family HTH domain